MGQVGPAIPVIPPVTGEETEGEVSIDRFYLKNTHFIPEWPERAIGQPCDPCHSLAPRMPPRRTWDICGVLCGNRGPHPANHLSTGFGCSVQMIGALCQSAMCSASLSSLQDALKSLECQILHGDQGPRDTHAAQLIVPIGMIAQLTFSPRYIRLY